MVTRFGDGVIVTTLQTSQGAMATSLQLERCRVEHNVRAGIASFGAEVALGSSLIGCNALDLAGEPYETRAFELTDLGGNLCGCSAPLGDCQVASTGLLPPDPLGR